MAAALLILYVGVNTGFQFKFAERQGLLNLNMLADAFLDGSLHLKEPVDEGRLKSGDPLNPSLPYPFLVDAIIWDDKYYVHQQPFPALIHAGWSALTGRNLPTGAVIVAAAFGNVLLLGIVFVMLRDRYFEGSPWWIAFYVWLSFGLSSAQLYIVGRPGIYHEVIALGSFFALTGAALIIGAVAHSKNNPFLFAASGAFFGTAIVCRLVSILCVAGFVLGIFIPKLIHERQTRLVVNRLMLFLVFPICAIAALLAYNYLRFGNPLYFGESHAMCPTYEQYVYTNLGNNYLRLKHVPYNLYNYFLRIPYLGALSSWNGFPVAEHVHSVVLASPVLLLSLSLPFLARYWKGRKGLCSIIWSCCLSSLLLAGLFLAWCWASPRFGYEFTLLMYIVAYCCLGTLWELVSDRPILKRGLWVALLIIFCLQLVAATLYAQLAMRS